MRSPSDLLAFARSPEGTKMVRYASTSLICVVISEAVLTFLGLIGWRAIGAVLVATAVATVPSYELNRRWAWGESGKRDMWKQVVPFWVLSFAGLAFSLVVVSLAQSVADHHHLSRVVRTGLLDLAYIGGYGLLWVGKFLILNKILFAQRSDDLTPA